MAEDYQELVASGASEAEIRAFLSQSEQTAVTIRVPKNLKSAIEEEAEARGMSFSAFVRSCVVEELAKPAE